MFNDFGAFKQAIVSMFGNPGKERRAAGELLQLQQTGTVVNYTAKFQQLQAKAGWHDKAAVDQFYRGLNNRIKDQIAFSRRDCPDQILQIIRIATDIGDRIYKQAIERKDRYIVPR
jgi:hypothetical protein